MARRLPIFLLIDTSGSMHGEPIEAAKNGISSMLESLKDDPYALETVYLCLITYDREAIVRVPLTELDHFVPPNLPVPETSPTNTGAALKKMMDLCDKEVRKSIPSSASSPDGEKGDWMPVVILVTDGSPSDTMDFEEAIERLKRYRFANFIALAAGPAAKVDPLKRLTKDVFTMSSMTQATFSEFWKWVSTTVERQSQTADNPKAHEEPQALPAPPSKIIIPV